jgi:NitT/TauT family transport system ATP-binding protein
MSETTAVAISVKGVDKVYPNGTHALQPVDLEIRQGEFVTLLGPSGCGKSTLLKMMAGLLPLDNGSLQVWGQAPDAAQAADRSMAFVFQSPTLMPWATVSRNVSLPLELAGMPKAQIAPRVADALKLVGLEQFGEHLPNALSGGMQMRVSIARAFVINPSILLMDEPFGALDEITRHKLDAELLEIWRARKVTVVFVTHSIHEAVFLSSRVVMMAARPGRIVDEFQITEPYPRTTEFMVTPQFSQYAKRLQDSLHRASTASVQPQAS